MGKAIPIDQSFALKQVLEGKLMVNGRQLFDLTLHSTAHPKLVYSF